MENKKKLIVLKNQGFCFGVLRAIKMCEESLDKLEQPIYLLGHLVHNKNVSNHFKEKGVTILDDPNRLNSLNQINHGSVILTAHGVGSNIYQKLKEKHLSYFDTTCPFVKKTFDSIMSYVNKGYDCIYIGKKNHPETEAIISESDKIHLIEKIEDLASLNLKNKKLVLSNQTTMSIYDIDHIIAKAKQQYPDLIVLKTICNATKARQKELSDTLTKLENEDVLVIVIGDTMSNNTKMLENRAKSFKNSLTIKIEGANELDINLVNKFNTVVITSGASTPFTIVNEVIELIKTKCPLF